MVHCSQNCTRTASAGVVANAREIQCDARVTSARCHTGLQGGKVTVILVHVQQEYFPHNICSATCHTA